MKMRALNLSGEFVEFEHFDLGKYTAPNGAEIYSALLVFRDGRQMHVICDSGKACDRLAVILTGLGEAELDIKTLQINEGAGWA